MDSLRHASAAGEPSYLHEACERAIEAEAEGKLPADLLAKLEPQSGRLYGFALDAIEAKARAVESERRNRRELLKAYRDDAHVLAKRLASIGIEPLAVITVPAWNEMLRRAGLLSMTPSPDGDLYLPLGLARRLRGQAAGTFWTGAVTFWSGAFAFLCGVWLAWSIGFDEVKTLTASVALATLITVVSFAVTRGIDEIRIRRRYAARRREYMATTSWADFLRDLAWKNLYLGSEGYSSDEHLAMKVSLPNAPGEVVDKIRKLHDFRYRDEGRGLQLRIAAVPDAIWLDGGMARYFSDSFEAIRDMERARGSDPIVCVAGPQRRAMAIIAQFGEWKIERAVIDAVLNSEHLL